MEGARSFVGWEVGGASTSPPRPPPLLFPNCRRRCSRSLQICQHFEHQHKHKSKHKQGTLRNSGISDIVLPSLLVLVGHHEPSSYLWPPYSRCLFIGLLLFCPFPPVRLPTATLEPNNHLPKPKSLGPSVRSVRPFWFEITVPSCNNSLLPLD